MVMVPRLVVFDMAGTTVDDGDAVGRCLVESLAQAGVAADVDRVNAVMGLPKPEAIRILLEGTPGVSATRSDIDAIHTDFVTRMNRFYRDDPSVTEVPGTSRTFAILQNADIRLALNTGFSRTIAETIIHRLKWTPWIDASVTSDEVLRGRPFPDMIFRLMDQLAIADTRSVAKVGDTPVDLEEGTQAGCGWVIGVVRGTHTREQLAHHPHTHLVESVADLLGVFSV
jgi:phosphonatase-like hydrolase